MAAIFIKNKDVLTFTDPVAKYKNPVRWWAERGRIHWEQIHVDKYGSISIRQCLIRLQAIQDMIKNSRKGRSYMRPDEITIYQNYIDEMLELCKKAKAQGDTEDPRAMKQKADDIKTARRSKVLMVNPSAALASW